MWGWLVLQFHLCIKILNEYTVGRCSGSACSRFCIPYRIIRLIIVCVFFHAVLKPIITCPKTYDFTYISFYMVVFNSFLSIQDSTKYSISLAVRLALIEVSRWRFLLCCWSLLLSFLLTRLVVNNRRASFQYCWTFPNVKCTITRLQIS